MVPSKKVMVRCDMEGVSGVVDYAQVTPGQPDYEFGRRMLMNDLLALLEGLEASGIEEVVLYDEHKGGRNIDLERLPDHVTAICGKPPYRNDWAGGLDSSFMGMILLGLHAKAKTQGALMPHTYESVIADLRLNGISIGEIGLEAAIAAEHRVPTLLVTADSAGAVEAEEFLPGVRTVVVKESHSEAGARCFPPSATARQIKKAASDVIKFPPQVKLFQIVCPTRLEVELHQGPFLKTASQLFAQTLVDNRTLVIEGESVTIVWASYWQMKLQVQAAL